NPRLTVIFGCAPMVVKLVRTRGGRLFEDAGLEFMQRAVGGHGYLGGEHWKQRWSALGVHDWRRGDRVPAGHAFAGARIMAEAKRDKSYWLTSALAELEQARANRGACVGIFVMPKKPSCGGFPDLGSMDKTMLIVSHRRQRRRPAKRRRRSS